MNKPLVVREEGVSVQWVWLCIVSRWQVKVTALHVPLVHTKGKVAVVEVMPPSLVVLPPDKKRKIDVRGSSVSTIKFEPRAAVRDIASNTRKRKQAGTGRRKKLLRFKRTKVLRWTVNETM